MINFNELNDYPGGEGLEALARFLGRRIPAKVNFSGKGTDQGRDLVFEEVPSGLRKRPHRWLVQCKDYHASGRSVSEKDLGFSIMDKLTQHNCNGFLLVTTTVASTGLKSLLDSLQAQEQCDSEVWDCHELENQLWQSRNVDLLAQFFPRFYAERFGRSYVIQDSPTFYTQADMNVDAGAEFDKVNQELNSLTLDILDSPMFSKNQKKHLRKAQQYWSKFISHDGCMYHPPEDGGTMGPVIRLSHMATLTQSRVEMLKEWWQSNLKFHSFSFSEKSE